MKTAVNMSHIVKRSADAFPVAAIVSTLSAKSLCHMLQFALAFSNVEKVASLMRHLSLSQFVNLLQMRNDGFTVGEYWTKLPPKAELEKHLQQAVTEARERLARHGVLL